MLYNFATYGSDKASSKFFLEPEHYWGKFTANRIWTQLPLSVSYRLTPNIATFCNVFWGTTMTGGNTQSPNIPVEYYIKYPYPDTRNLDNPEKLSTRFLANIIDEHGPENVLFLAQSVKSERLPVRVHVNDLMKISDPKTGEQKYNFHIKESVRGFEGKADLKNKVRVWTFCGSKGCEADVVIVFGFDIFFGRPHGLNQVGVALSRAKKRLLVMHGKQFDQESREYIPLVCDRNLNCSFQYRNDDKKKETVQNLENFLNHDPRSYLPFLPRCLSFSSSSYTNSSFLSFFFHFFFLQNV